MKMKWFLPLGMVVCAFLFATSVLGQRITGAVSGQVLDSSGSAVFGAKVALENEEKVFKVELQTGEEGSFVAPDVPPGTYKVVIQHPGFKTFSTTAVVRVNGTTSLVAKLEIGEVSSMVMVESGAITVDTATATVQGVITGDQIDRLPLNGRNFLDLATQEPGVQTVDGGTFDPTKNQMVGVSVGGRSGRSTRIQVDGVDITDETVGTTVANISNESIQEFSISQSSLDPSTDLTSTGSVNIVTKSGTNSLHGSGFGFFRDSAYAADQRLTKVGPKPPSSRRNYGGRLGGPLIKNHLFWALDYEKLQQDDQRVTNIPEFPQFTGNFGVPLTERMGSARADWVVNNKLNLFYRFQHDDNFGVTGFGGTDLAAFSNLNNTNFHIIGADYHAGRWNHAIRFSYVNFNNFIVDADSAAGTPDTLDPGGSPILVRITGRLQDAGPDLLAPQQTFQDNKQTKYDASVVFGRHTLSFGAEYNHIEQFVFASFFGLAPRLRASYNSSTLAFAGGDPFSSEGILDPLNFPVNQIVIGNGLGFFSEKPALGFPHGGTVNHRIGFYAHDSFKWTSHLTVNYGLRYNWNSSLSNHDLARTPLLGVFDPSLAGHPRRPADNFAPQAGFAWNVFGDGKTVIRGGAGLFYETNIFNNLLFDRVLMVPPGLGNDTPVITGGSPLLLDPSTGNTLFDYSADCTGLPGNSCIGAAIGQVIPFAQHGQQLLQQASSQLAGNWPQPGVSPLFDQILDTEGSVLDNNYKSPYGIQFNIGVQRELRPGLVLSVDYVRNRGVHFNLVRDRNRIGAANTLDVATAQAAIAATLSDCGVATIDQAILGCAANGGDPATIGNFADNGLGAGSGVDGFAFSGKNRNFRTMGIIEPQGLSLYQALQVRLRGDLGQHGPFKHLTTNITYALGRFESTGLDQDFLSTSAFNDRPTQFFGPANEDRLHQIGFSFLADLPWGFRFNVATKINSPLASSMFLPLTTGGADEIFYSDLDGDGVTEDPLTGTNRGSYTTNRVTASGLNKLIGNYNSNVAGTLGPAAQSLVQAGLFTPDQLTALGAVLTSVQPAPAGQVNNDWFYNTDMRISKVFKIRERLTIEPMVECFNVFNIANYARLNASLDGGAGDINGTPKGSEPTRVGQGSGSFSPGIQRAFQFGIRVSF
jgi:Carboxypeptidase regulatory-like domain